MRSYVTRRRAVTVKHCAGLYRASTSHAKRCSAALLLPDTLALTTCLAMCQVVIHEATGHRRRQGSGGAGSDDDASSQSSTGSPKGARGGGTLKTCAVCLEDYRRAYVIPCAEAQADTSHIF